MEGDWVKLQQLPKIGENVEIADRAFQKFQEMQTEHGMQSNDLEMLSTKFVKGSRHLKTN
jgi:hypothetical protein